MGYYDSALQFSRMQMNGPLGMLGIFFWKQKTFTDSIIIKLCIDAIAETFLENKLKHDIHETGTQMYIWK